MGTSRRLSDGRSQLLRGTLGSCQEARPRPQAGRSGSRGQGGSGAAPGKEGLRIYIIRSSIKGLDVEPLYFGTTKRGSSLAKKSSCRLKQSRSTEISIFVIFRPSLV